MPFTRRCGGCTLLCDGTSVVTRSLTQDAKWCGRREFRRRCRAARDPGAWRKNVGEVRRANSMLLFYPAHAPVEVRKVVATQSWEWVKAEFDSLTSLWELSRGKSWTVPEPRELIPDANGYAMSYVAGRRVDIELRRHGRPGTETSLALERIGGALARIHAAWAVTCVRARAWESLEADLTRLPVGRDALRALGDAVGSGLSAGRFVRLYWDFDPVNVVQAGGLPSLLDPPGADVRGSVGWDLGTFIAGLRRAHWRRRPFSDSWAVTSSEAAFVTGYEREAGPLTGEDRLLIEIGCLLRLLQLRAWWRRPWMPRWSAWHVVLAAWSVVGLRRAITAQAHRVLSMVRGGVDPSAKTEK